MNGSRTLKLLTKRLELTAATMDHVCAELDAPETLAAHAAPANPASCRVLEKCGFRRVCTDEESGNHRFEILRICTASLPASRI